MPTCFIFFTYPPFKLNAFDTTGPRSSVLWACKSTFQASLAALSVFNNDSNVVFNNDSKVFLTNIHLSTSNVDLFSIASLAACTIFISGKRHVHVLVFAKFRTINMPRFPQMSI